MKKVIFLDFDGVLNTENYQAQLRDAGEPCWDDFGQVFDPEAVENLKMILEAVPDALLVINSSWKLEGIARMKELWKVRGLPGKIHSVTPDYVPDLLNIDLDNYDNITLLAGKGNEVKQWLEENAPEDCKYVILDDVPDFLPDQNPHLILTNTKTGITMEDAVMAIEILK
ncbi:MAG: hypothetical protein E7109_00315 [Bacteroidales bacterium]|nr:hypothetical protein [Bacteroidales bacterium]